MAGLATLAHPAKTVILTSEVKHESVCIWARRDHFLMSAARRLAEPLDLKQIPADAKWLLHVDVDAMRESTLVKNAWPKAMEMHKNAEQKLKEMQDKFGIDVCKDLHGLTAYGRELGKHTGVLIVHAKFDLKLAEATAAKAKDHKVVKFESYHLHSWTEKHHGHERTVWAAAYKSDGLVFASSDEYLKAALAVLDGKASAVASGPLAGRVRPGTTILARATGIADAEVPCHSPIAKQIRSLRFSMGEDSGQLFFSRPGDDEERRVRRRFEIDH